MLFLRIISVEHKQLLLLFVIHHYLLIIINPCHDIHLHSLMLKAMKVAKRILAQILNGHLEFTKYAKVLVILIDIGDPSHFVLVYFFGIDVNSFI